MRIIGHLADKARAERFSLYLLSKGIANQCEPDGTERHALWVHCEDQLTEAESLLNQFLQNPDDAAYLQGAVTGSRQQRKDDQAQRRVARAAKKRRRRTRVSAVGHVTLTIIVLCILVFMLSDMGSKRAILNHLLISAYVPVPGVPWWDALIEVRNGQFWRLVSPIFVHFGLLHILFNMLWMFDLGSMIERRKGSPFLVLFIMAVAIPSNLAQYAFSGPMFGGMSGVVYAMLGYIWMRSRFAPEDGMYLNPSTVTMMLVWLALGFFGAIGQVANIVHAVGLLSGLAWGYLSTRRFGE